mgnify:CR=1 FL=1
MQNLITSDVVISGGGMVGAALAVALSRLGLSITVLERQARWMGQYPQVQVMVEGHADERGEGAGAGATLNRSAAKR